MQGWANGLPTLAACLKAETDPGVNRIILQAEPILSYVDLKPKRHPGGCLKLGSRESVTCVTADLAPTFRL